MAPLTPSKSAQDAEPEKNISELRRLVACVASSKTPVEIDWDEFLKHDDAPNVAAA